MCLHFKVLKVLHLPVLKKLILFVIALETVVLKIHNHYLVNQSMYIKMIVSLNSVFLVKRHQIVNGK